MGGWGYLWLALLLAPLAWAWSKVRNLFKRRAK